MLTNKIQLKTLKASCPSCSTANLFPFEEAESCTVCSNCRSIYKPSEPLALRKNLLKEVKDLFLLPLGTTFQWNKESYTITGYVVKREKEDSAAVWIEYFLTHATLPNIYISCYNGHWTVITYLPDIVRPKGSVKNRYNMTYQKVEYDFQHHYTAQILDAQGCFNFPFYEDDENKVREFVNFDEVLIWEENKQDENLRFYKGIYLYANDLKKNLSPAVKMPKRIGYVAHQPFYFPLNPRSFRLMSILLVLCMAFGMVFWDTFFERKSINEGRLEVSTENPNTITSRPFTVAYDHSILNIEASVYNMANDWIYAEMALLNTQTGEERYFEMETEFYSGYEGGEHWSEGDKTINGNIQYVDAGTYVLEATPKQAVGSVPKTVQFRLTSQKGSWSIFWVLVGIIALINITLALIGDYFNHKKRGEEYDTFKQ